MVLLVPRFFVIPGVPSCSRVVKEGNQPPSLRRCFPQQRMRLPLSISLPIFDSVWAMRHRRIVRSFHFFVLRAPIGPGLKPEGGVFPLLPVTFSWGVFIFRVY